MYCGGRDPIGRLATIISSGNNPSDIEPDLATAVAQDFKISDEASLIRTEWCKPNEIPNTVRLSKLAGVVSGKELHCESFS